MEASADAPATLTLRVALVGAQYLPVLNANGRSDPYAELTSTITGLDRWRERPAVAPNTVHPRWDASIEKSLEGCTLGPADELRVRILNRDRLWRDAELGHCALAFRSIWNMEGHRMPISPVVLQRHVSKAQLSKPSILLGRLSGNFDSASNQFRVASADVRGAARAPSSQVARLVVGVQGVL